jgi:hypothetical protein
MQSSQGKTLQPQSALSLGDFVGFDSVTLAGVGSENFGLADRVASCPAIAELGSGIQRANGVKSATSAIYQHFFVASQRAPSALTASFFVNGVTKLILMLQIYSVNKKT